ncbi:Rossmann-like and DUF2520 domain-containing protein [Flavobacterium sp.]|uniref:Rossmann-like and DUF2520 domain-containing protein n=1 Tax=Flavobacterium sp. TaxID=239 RepID=UPI003751D5B8
MIRVVIIGSGNVAQHLIKAFAKSDNIDVIKAFSRNKENLENIIDSSKISTDLNDLIDADLYIISVSDNAIAEVSHQLNIEKKLVVHTSGSITMTDLNNKNRKGVFYPLQTFSKSKEVNFNEIPICLEAENNEDYKLLETVAKSISEKIFNINSNQRKALHVSAVFVNNFVNHLYKIGNDICNKNNIPFEILQPLIQETANKISLLSPNDAQTGPAKRNDTQTINSHLQFLTNENQKEIYKLLTKSIIDNGKKL